MSSTTSPTTTASVFWPQGSTRSGVCYGWVRPAICVAGVIDDPDAELDVALSRSPLWQAVKGSCGGDPTLLGTCIFDTNTRSPVPTSIQLWDFGQPEITFSFVLYRRHTPQSLRFYVMKLPRNLTLTAPAQRDPYSELAQHDFTSRKPRNLDRALNETVINQLNASALAHLVLQSPPSSFPQLLPITATFLLTLASYLGSLSTLSLSLSRLARYIANIPVFPTAAHLLGRGANSKTLSPRYIRLKEVSATVQQFDVRVEQAVFFITQVTTLRRQNTQGILSYSSRYTNFFNTIWLIMNDMTLGFAFGTFLLENSAFLAETSNQAIQTFLFHLPRTTLHWLDAWPAGLKLNAELSRFYVHILIGIIDTADALLPPLAPSLFVTLGGLSRLGGLTLLLSVVSDILSLFLTVHLRIGYELTRLVYWAAGVKLGGGLLWGVFRGKRHNVLRNRTDTWSYDIDQLLFGTVLFTLLAFLFPTALVYYVLFAGLRLATLLAQASIETLLAFMHHFPLFALMLRVKDPWRLPGGVYFTLRTPSPIVGGGITPVHLVLENQPIPLSAIFFQYIELWNRLTKHYNPLRLLYQVLAGQHIESIPRYSIRYGGAVGLDVPKDGGRIT